MSCPQTDNPALLDNSLLHAKPLNSNFSPRDIKPWDSGRFTLVRKIQQAHRNKGQVYQMLDANTGQHVAVKQMPNTWVCKSHARFVASHSYETERPWVDIGCTSFLCSLGYPYACPLLGVFRDAGSTYVLSELATNGDVFGLIAACEEEPGPRWEGFVHPLSIQMMDALRHLHNLSIVHRDVCCENFLLSRRPGEGALRIQLIDFSMATAERVARGREFGKPMYQAPEVHKTQVVDGFLSDTFSMGVVLYCLVMQEFPWCSTEPGACKIFSFFQKKGFRGFAQRRKRLRCETTILQHLSEQLVQLLEGLLMADPSCRLTLGEAAAFAPGRKEVWMEPWVRGNWDEDPRIGCPSSQLRDVKPQSM